MPASSSGTQPSQPARTPALRRAKLQRSLRLSAAARRAGGIGQRGSQAARPGDAGPHCACALLVARTGGARTAVAFAAGHRVRDRLADVGGGVLHGADHFADHAAARWRSRRPSSRSCASSTRPSSQEPSSRGFLRSGFLRRSLLRRLSSPALSSKRPKPSSTAPSSKPSCSRPSSTTTSSAAFFGGLLRCRLLRRRLLRDDFFDGLLRGLLLGSHGFSPIQNRVGGEPYLFERKKFVLRGNRVARISM